MMQLMNSVTQGLIYSLLALAFNQLSNPVFRDLTVEGSIALGGAVAATLLDAGWNRAGRP